MPIGRPPFLSPANSPKWGHRMAPIYTDPRQNPRAGFIHSTCDHQEEPLASLLLIPDDYQCDCFAAKQIISGGWSSEGRRICQALEV